MYMPCSRTPVDLFTILDSLCYSVLPSLLNIHSASTFVLSDEAQSLQAFALRPAHFLSTLHFGRCLPTCKTRYWAPFELLRWPLPNGFRTLPLVWWGL